MTHGMSGTFNNMRVQVPAYMLRSLGFSVLLPNLRNHGTSGAADHGALSWGYDLWLDVLGAWDYAVMDPDGTLGGAIEPSQVGMFANSMGGFASAIAFAKETAVPAVWLDAPVWNPKDNLLGATLEGIFGVIHPIFTEPAWSIIKLHTGIDLDLYLPEEALKASSGKRPVYITQNKQDSAISIEVGEGVLRFLEENSDKYEAESWFPEEACNGEGHSMSAVKYPTIYREKLCTFFSNAFNMSNNCAANALPILEGNA
jgi:alpha-beta hydrolase superfamily lysophospholipase